MSTFQYYEWQTMDRPLSAEERREVGLLSSHIHVSATRAQVDYNWGDFKHDPREVLVRYFDAFLYWANWGGKRLMFRFPAHLIDAGRIEPYCVDRYIELHRLDDIYVLEFDLLEEDSWGWIEPEGQLAMLSPLRGDILRGDYRVLYLGWLKAMEIVMGYELNEDEPEPPVPPGLKTLDATLQAFVDFVELDEHLLQAAAEASPLPQRTPDQHLLQAIARLPRAECEDFLRRLFQDEPQLHVALRKRLEQLAGVEPREVGAAPRILGTLVERAKALAQIARERQRAAQEAVRLQKLADLASRKEQIWREVERLIETYRPGAYDEAVDLLVALRELAEHQGAMPAFQQRISALHERYSRRTGLRGRLREAGLGS